LLTLHPEYVQVRIEGHTDEMGGAEYNRKLSESRASAVRTFLMKNGVQADRLVAVGLGESHPIIHGNTEEAVTVNRRVEFLITRRRTVLNAKDGNPVEGAVPNTTAPEANPEQKPESAPPSEPGSPTRTPGGTR
jgi:hypothetical protein